MKLRNLLLTLILSATCPLAGAADFFSTEKCDKLFTLGARIGLNTSNATLSEKVVGGYNVNGWGTGFDIGAVCDLNIRDYLSVQPGLFYQSRSNDYSYVYPGAAAEGNTFNLTQLGHFRSYHLVIPVMASFHFNVSDDVRWDVDAGPYISFCLGSSRNDKSVVASDDIGDWMEPFDQKAKRTDVGLKFGTALQVLGHYYIGVHYMAGMRGPWKDIKYDNVKVGCGGANKAWTFTLGYNF